MIQKIYPEGVKAAIKMAVEGEGPIARDCPGWGGFGNDFV